MRYAVRKAEKEVKVVRENWAMFNIQQHTNQYKAKSGFLISWEIKGLSLHKAKKYTITQIMDWKKPLKLALFMRERLQEHCHKLLQRTIAKSISRKKMIEIKILIWHTYLYSVSD